MFLSDLSIKRPVLTTCVMLALVILGLFSMRTLGWDLYPNVDIPVVTVSVTYPGASPDAVEQDVIKKIEEAVNPIEKVRRDQLHQPGRLRHGRDPVRHLAQRGQGPGRRALQARPDPRRTCPDTIKEPVIQKFDPAQTPVLSLVVKPGRRPQGHEPPGAHPHRRRVPQAAAGEHPRRGQGRGRGRLHPQHPGPGGAPEAGVPGPQPATR